MLAELVKPICSALPYEKSATWIYWEDDRAFSSLNAGNLYQATDFLLKVLDSCPLELKTTKKIVLASILEKGGYFAQLLSMVSAEALMCWVELASSLRRYFDSGDQEEYGRVKDLIIKIREIFLSSEFVANHEKLRISTRTSTRGEDF